MATQINLLFFMISPLPLAGLWILDTNGAGSAVKSGEAQVKLCKEVFDNFLLRRSGALLYKKKEMEPILMIDDDRELCEMVAEYLAPEGFKVDAVHNGERGLERALDPKYSLILLDVMLPGMNGFDLLRKLRTTSNTRVLLLTARGEEVDRIVGLEIGADDYLPKPFNPRELLARIRAVLRRSGKENAPAEAEIAVGDVVLDPRSRTVRRDSEPVELTAVEFNLLEVLLRSAGKIVDREQLATIALGRSLNAFDRSIDMHISKLRRKLGELPGGGERIKTIRSAGYLYAAPARKAQEKR
jgi:two-component system response regulator CpxR